MARNRLSRRETRRARRSERRRLAHDRAAAAVPPGSFEVLCRIDAYADYVAVVEADCAEEAAHLANNGHGAYRWEHRGVQEFDARLYVALDSDGAELVQSEVREL